MDAVKKINRILKESEGRKNNTGDIYINVIKNEFIFLNGRIEVPKLPVKELGYVEAVNLVKDIADYIPEFLSGHNLLVNRKPASEQHCLHFVRKIRGRAFNYIHIFKIYLKFEGNTSNIIEKGDTEKYPSYHTDRIYYKSILIPAGQIERDDEISIFSPIKMVSPYFVQSDQKLFTSAIFDEMDRKAVTKDIHERLAVDIFNISTSIYPFIVFDYYTACFNVLYPTADEIEKAVAVFEPLFITVFSKYNDIRMLENYEQIKEAYSDQIYFVEEAFLKIKFLDELKSYFAKWKLYRDDDLVLKGWWKISD